MKRFVGLGLVLFAFIAITTNHSPVLADPDSWVSSSSIVLDKIRDLNAGELPVYSINGNRDCIQEKVVTRPYKVVPLQAEQNHQSCVVDTGYGAYSQSGYLQRQGTTVSGQVRLAGGNLVNIIPIPRSETSLRMGSPGANGVNLYFTKNYGSAISSSADSFGQVSHVVPPDYTSALKDKSGQLFYTQPDSISFSSNGQWMVVDNSFIGTVRVNLETFEVLPFGPAYNYNVGLIPSIQSAISSDGRYAVLFSKSFGRFKIYDLSTCATVPNFIIGPVNCQSRDLYSHLPGQAPQNDGVSTIRFISNDALSMYVNYTEGGVSKTGQFVLRFGDKQIFDMDYLALGDSYTSGEGAYQYKAATDTNLNKCHLSQVSYPYLLGQSLSFNKYESVACSGATIYDLINTDKNYDGQLHDKITRESRNAQPIFSSFTPGYLAQSEFIDNYSSRVVTVSTIGNDIGFSKKLMRCLEPDTCYATYEDRVEILRQVNAQFNKLTGMYKQLKSADPRTKIYVIGYPQIARPNGNCAINVRLDNSEVQFAEDLINYLNSVIKQAAAHEGISYVDISDALYGFRLCEPDGPWDVAVNGLTAGNDIVKNLGGPIGNESYHPTAFGQNLIAKKVSQQTAGFTTSMPEPNSSAAPPQENDSIALLQMPHSGRDIEQVNYDDNLSNDVVFRNGAWNIPTTELNILFKPFSTIRAILHSDPVDLGALIANASGGVSGSLTIPASVSPGWHTLHLYGQNTASEAVDIYKEVYIAASQNDYNGDGTPNDSDPCPTSTTSKTDIDNDRIDDACDGYIGQYLGSTLGSLTSSSSTIQQSLVTFLYSNQSLASQTSTYDKEAVQAATDGSLALSSSTLNANQATDATKVKASEHKLLVILLIILAFAILSAVFKIKQSKLS